MATRRIAPGPQSRRNTAPPPDRRDRSGF